MADEPKTLREAWERVQAMSTSYAAESGRPDAAVQADASIMTMYVMAARDVIGILKRTEPDRLVPAIWRMERDLAELGRESTTRMVDAYGARAIAEALLRRHPGDGDALDVRPPGRRGR